MSRESLQNGKWNRTWIERTLSDHGCTKEIATGFPSKNVEREVSEVQTMTLEAVKNKVEGVSHI